MRILLLYLVSLLILSEYNNEFFKIEIPLLNHNMDFRSGRILIRIYQFIVNFMVNRI